MATQTILSFHHFVELSFKLLLAERHALLAAVGTKEHVTLDRLLKGEVVSEEEALKMQWIEFSDAAARIHALIDSNRLDSKFAFLKQAKATTDALNGLRNRLLHRGTWILHGGALDLLVARYVLPLALNITKALPAVGVPDWRPESLACKIDPIQELVNTACVEPIDHGRLALLKELIRAAYENPLHHGPWDTHDREQVESRVKHEVKRLETTSDAGPKLHCPVCDQEALIVHFDFETCGDDDDILAEFPYKAKCVCCGFHITPHVHNASAYGLTGIADFWP